MKVARIFTILLLILTALSMTGCTLSSKDKHAFFYERPAIGPVAEDELSTDVELKNQSMLRIDTVDGIIKISRWDRDYLKITEKRKLKGPASKASLNELLEAVKCKVDSSSYEIKLKVEPDKEIKPLFRRTEDLELMVPEALKSIHIKANSGAIIMSGFQGLSGVDLVLEKGSIKLDNCEADSFYLSIAEGNTDFKGIKGLVEYEGGRGDISFKDIDGNIKLKLTAGDTIIENAEGKLDCDISTGNLSVIKSLLKADSVIYMSYGNIKVDFDKLESSGKYTIKAATGNIKINMLQKSGWSLLAESTKGRIINNTGIPSDELQTSPSGELYGDVGGGGPMIDVYIDRGDIILK